MAIVSYPRGQPMQVGASLVSMLEKAISSSAMVTSEILSELFGTMTDAQNEFRYVPGRNLWNDRINRATQIQVHWNRAGT